MTAILGFMPIIWGFIKPLIFGGFRHLMLFASEPRNLIVGALIAGIMYGWGHHDGRQKERGIWEVKIASERKSQRIITDAAEAAAIRDLEEIRTQLEASNAKVTELNAAAAADPNAGRVCLGTDSLQRINKGRKSRP